MSLYVIVWGGKAKYCRKGIIKKIFDIEEHSYVYLNSMIMIIIIMHDGVIS